jgi:hypothetical protein
VGKNGAAVVGQFLTTQKIRGDGNVTPNDEQYLLDLEREAFKSLCGENT